MVAYNFQPQFVPVIISWEKHQTIRAARKKRHAHVGERLQLYSGQRTKNCQKLFDNDPICNAVDSVEIYITDGGKIEQIVLNGRNLNSHEIEDFAKADGFMSVNGLTARDAMGEFFLDYHGSGLFRGKVIRWSAVE